jgi:hypothetical protein
MNCIRDAVPVRKLARPMLSRIPLMQAAILIERDGILNRVLPSHPYPRGPLTFEELELNTRALEPLAR